MALNPGSPAGPGDILVSLPISHKVTEPASDAYFMQRLGMPLAVAILSRQPPPQPAPRRLLPSAASWWGSVPSLGEGRGAKAGRVPDRRALEGRAGCVGGGAWGPSGRATAPTSRGRGEEALSTVTLGPDKARQAGRGAVEPPLPWASHHPGTPCGSTCELSIRPGSKSNRPLLKQVRVT